MRWRLALMSAVTLLLVPLAACTVPPDGNVGIGPNADGVLTVYLRTCHYPMDGATMYWPDDPNGANSNEEVFADWKIKAQPARLQLNWPLIGAGNDIVSATHPLRAVPGKPKDMAIYAWTDDNSYSADGPYQFRARDLLRLKPGQVLTSDPDGSTVTSISKFNDIDCSQFGP